MNFSDERYVRLYVRDTNTWIRWTWEARATFALLLRKLYRDGTLPLDGDTAEDAIATQTGLPVAVIAAALPQLLRPNKLGEATLIIEGDRIRAPNFRTAQEAKASDALRAQEYRDRQRVTQGDASVTHRDASNTQRDAASRIVTGRHSSLAEPSEPSLAEPKKKRLAATASPSPPPPMADSALLGFGPETSGDRVEDGANRPTDRKGKAPTYCTRDEALTAIASTSGGRFVPSPPGRGGSFKLNRLRQQPDALAVCHRVGRWLGAGGDGWKGKLDGRHFGNDIDAWIAQSEAWARAGGGPVNAQTAKANGKPRIVGPAEVSDFSHLPEST